MTKEQAVLESQKAMIRNALDNGKPEVALQNLRTMLQDHPSDASLQSLMGLTQLALKNSARAVKHFQIAYKLDRKVATGLNLSSALIESGDYARATRLLTQLLKQADGDHYTFKERIFHNLGYCYMKQKKAAKAEHWFQEALEENPAFFPSHLELASLYERTKRPAMAMKEYRRAIDYCTVCYEPVEALSSLYTRMGKPADARVLLTQYVKIEGVSPEDRARATQQLQHATTAGLAPMHPKG